MENTFIVNIIHRPEMVPEYAEKVTGHGQAEDIGRKALLTESLDIFKFQQETAHKNGLKTTIQMTYASLFNEEAVSLAKEHHEKYGDERLINNLNNFLRIKNDVLVFKGNFFFSYLAYLRIRASSSMSNFDGYSYILDKSSKNKNKDYASAYEMLINMYKYCMPRDEKILKRKEASLY